MGSLGWVVAEPAAWSGGVPSLKMPRGDRACSAIHLPLGRRAAHPRKAMMSIQTLHVTGHAIDGLARHDGFLRVSRHVNFVVRRLQWPPRPRRA